MEQSAPASGKKAGHRKGFIAAGTLAVVAALYGVGWNIAASQIRDRLLQALTGQDSSRLAVQCHDARMGGFPLAMSLHCTRLTADDEEHGVSSTIGPAQAEVSLFSPNHVHSKLKGPVEIRSKSGLLAAEWQSFTSDIGFGLAGMQSTRFESEALKATFTDPLKGNALQAKTDHFSAFAENRDSDLVTGLSTDGAVLSRNGQLLPLPPLRLEAALRVSGRGDLIGRFDRQALYGTSGEIETLTANLGEGRDITITGPFSVDESGRVSGKIRLEAKNVAAWIDAARQAVPDAAPMIDTAGSLIRSFTKGSPDLSLDLTLKRGKVLVAGFIPVGELPPL